MKKVILVDNETLNKTLDDTIDLKIKEYIKKRDSMKSFDEYEAVAYSMNDAMKLLNDTILLIPMELDFYDSKLKYDFNKGRINYDVYNTVKDKIKCNPVMYDLKLSEDSNYEKYLALYTKANLVDNNPYAEGVFALDFKTAVDGYFDKINGIIINPDTDNFIITADLVKYIYNGCNTVEFLEIFNKAKANIK